MALVRPIRKGLRSLVSCRAAVMCVAALSIFWARSAPPSLPHSPLSLAFHVVADHDHRQCFAQEDAQWATSPSNPPATPPPVISASSIHTAEPFIEFVTDGWHYNRPPPIS